MRYYVDNKKVTKEYFMEELEGAINARCEESYDDMLDECYEPYKIGCCTFYASQVLKECDPIAYRCGLSDYQSAELEEAQYEFEKEHFECIDTIDFETKEDAENPLEELENNCLGEFNGEVLYVGYDEENEVLYAGSATNSGIFRTYEIDYDFYRSLDANLEMLVEKINEQ